MKEYINAKFKLEQLYGFDVYPLKLMIME